MNDDNLRVPTSEEAREIGRKGGIASGEARRRKADLRKALEALLEKDFTDKEGRTLSGAEAIALKQMEKALKGDTRAFEVVRETSGQAVVQKVMIAEVEQEVIDEVEGIVFGYEPTASD